VIFIVPGMLILLGYWEAFEFWWTLLRHCGAAAACLGVLFTIPLRRALVVEQQAGVSPRAWRPSEILKAGAAAGRKDSGLKEILGGTVVAGLFTFLSNGLQVLGSGLSLWFRVGKGMTQFPLGYSTALVGAGYLIGIAPGWPCSWAC
jgi:putative OPT family oligopeptide transporter